MIVDHGLPEILNYSEGEDHHTCLMYACMAGRISVVKALIDRGADLNLRNMFGYTALEFAVSNKH
jgi:uncharacterized protein